MNFCGRLRKYASDCSITGLCYIANSNLHITERAFWLVCLTASLVGSYALISNFRDIFKRAAVSIVYEQLPPHHKPSFPAVSVCDNGDDSYELIQKSLAFANISEVSRYDIADFLLMVAYPPKYVLNVMQKSSKAVEEARNCENCPQAGYRQLSAKFQAGCTEIFQSCYFMDEPFECCRFFSPIITTNGKCFLFNSLLTDQIDSWPRFGDAVQDKYVLKLFSHKNVQVSVLNPEDIPFNSLQTISAYVDEWSHRRLHISVEEMTNDLDVLEISPAARKCRFADETLHNQYRAYSFTTCLSDCIRAWQVQLCNCTLYNYAPQEDYEIRDCDYAGYKCVAYQSLIRPDPLDLLPWASIHCDCMPSCTDNMLLLIAEDEQREGLATKSRGITISVERPFFRYRRQALRTNLDIVVTMGGILGFFMGASLLSGVELVYHITMRSR